MTRLLALIEISYVFYGHTELARNFHSGYGYILGTVKVLIRALLCYIFTDLIKTTTLQRLNNSLRNKHP